MPSATNSRESFSPSPAGPIETSAAVVSVPTSKPVAIDNCSRLGYLAVDDDAFSVVIRSTPCPFVSIFRLDGRRLIDTLEDIDRGKQKGRLATMADYHASASPPSPLSGAIDRIHPRAEFRPSSHCRHHSNAAIIPSCVNCPAQVMIRARMRLDKSVQHPSPNRVGGPCDGDWRFVVN